MLVDARAREAGYVYLELWVFVVSESVEEKNNCGPLCGATWGEDCNNTPRNAMSKK